MKKYGLNRREQNHYLTTYLLTILKAIHQKTKAKCSPPSLALPPPPLTASPSVKPRDFLMLFPKQIVT